MSEPGAAKLGLGTVQFGMHYGISNPGQTPEEEVREILAHAWAAGIDTLDTASAYGDSETVLGRSMQADQVFHVITKTAPTPGTEITSRGLENIERCFDRSLARLRRSHVHGILVHRAADLLGPGGDSLFELLARLKRTGLVSLIGASVYDSSEAQQLSGRFPLDLIQLPVNVFDQRLVRDGTLERLKAAGLEVHARSVLLQGLLLMEAYQLPDQLQRFAPTVARYRREISRVGSSPIAAALGFVKGLRAIDVVLIGIASKHQLEECLDAYSNPPALDYGRFAHDEPDLIDPRRWSFVC